MSTALTSPPPRGAGRLVDIVHDLDWRCTHQQNAPVSGGTQGGASASGRGGAQSSTGTPFYVSAMNGGSVSATAYRGRVGLALKAAPNGSTGSSAHVSVDQYRAVPMLARPATDLGVIPVAQVWSLSALVAWDGATAGAPQGTAQLPTQWNQCGIGINNLRDMCSHGVIAQSNSLGHYAGGFGFSLENGTNNIIWFQRLGYNGTILRTSVVWPVPITDWCPVEFRIYSATPTRNALLRVYVAGKLFREVSWDATSLPMYPDLNGPLGFNLFWTNQSLGYVPTVYAAGYRFIAAETEDAL